MMSCSFFGSNMIGLMNVMGCLVILTCVPNVVRPMHKANNKLIEYFNERVSIRNFVLGEQVYARYRFGPYDAFTFHLKEMYPNIQWIYPESWAEWYHEHEAYTILSRYDITLNASFDSNTFDVQLEEIYTQLCLFFNNFVDSKGRGIYLAQYGKVVIGVIGFDVKKAYNPLNRTFNTLLRIRFPVAFYPHE